jgi:AraC family transcriptional regulator
MNSQIEGHPSLADLSEAASLSPFYFVRLFKSMTGDTPLHYFRRLKALRTDKYLAENPEIDLTALALKFGYSSQSALTRDFRTLLGFLPGVCRNEFQKEKSNFLPKEGNTWQDVLGRK